MPTWIATTLWIAGALVTVAGAGTAVRRLVVLPMREAWSKLAGWLARIARSSDGVADVAREMQALSGAVVRLVVAIVDDQAQLRAEHEELRRNQTELVQLVVDLDAEYHRLRQLIDRRAHS